MSNLFARSVVALAFLALAGYLAFSFATMPYELTQSCTTMAQPNGAGTLIAGIFAGLAALVALFSGPWE